MTDKNNLSYDPQHILQAAIDELNLFTQPEASRLEVGENGRLIASTESPLEKVMGLARSYLGPLFSEQMRQQQAKKLGEIKQAILNARDIINSHSALIVKFKEGDDSQRKLADYALGAIQRYNAIVGQETSDTARYDVYNYERQRLLLDEEIKQPIELPQNLTIKYDSHPDTHPAKKMLKEIGDAFLFKANPRTISPICPTHKKTIQYMVDTFQVKAIRTMQEELGQQNSIAEIVQLVKETPLEIDEESKSDLILMQQFIQVGPGFYILLLGSFKRRPSDPKFLSMLILDSFSLSFKVTHAGFPYPSERSGWTLSDKWVEAYPLRADQVPLFQQIDQRRKRLAQKLLYDQPFYQKARCKAKLRKDVFDNYKELFLSLHLELQQTLRQGISYDKSILEAYYHEVSKAPSTFDFLVQTEQQLQDLFIKKPMKALEEEWLGSEPTVLRMGNPQEKFQTACQILEEQRDKAKKRLDPTHPRHAYLLEQGMLLGQAHQAIGLQFQSEKMGFSPPLLNDFERKLQGCAFHQLLSFLDECENRLEILDPDQIKNDLLTDWSKDLQILKASSEEQSSSLVIVDALEFYFNSRFYAYQPHRAAKIG